MGLSLTVSEVNGDFSRKSQNFPTPDVYFALRPLTGLPFELFIGTHSEKSRIMGLPDRPDGQKVLRLV